MLIRKQHLNLIRKIAWSFHNTTGLDWDDLFGEASLGYCEAVNSYNPGKGAKLTTWIYSCVQKKLINYCKYENRVNHNISLQDMPKDVLIDPIPYVELEVSMPKAVREIADIVLQTPHLYLSLPRTMARPLIAEKMMRYNNWTWSETQKAIKRMENLLEKTK
ncbi:MAG: hypothetical protein KGY70_16275 [Bacteroidales bacterium]|nr:hypothetical protein [Bacteroidales bacterium]